MKQIFITSLLRLGILSVISVSGEFWRSSFVLPEYAKEMFYGLEKNQIYGGVISRRYEPGLKLRVGKAWEKEIGDTYYRTKCSQLLGDDVYLDEYEPVIHFYGNQPSFKYTFMDKQVWNCTSYAKQYEKGPHSPINFYRIVSVVHGIRSVKTIFYFDGIEVRPDKTPVQSIEDHNSIWTASFKEIKYIDPNTGTVLRYDGNLALVPAEDLEVVPESKIFEPLDIFIETEFKKYEYERSESLGSIEVAAKTKNIGTSGDVLRVGKNDFIFIGKKEDKALCTLKLDEPLVFTNQYLPKCSIWKANSHNFDENYGGSVGKVNANCFSITNQELWECTFGESTKDGTINNMAAKTFHRRVTEMVGAIPLSKIEYFGAVSVWKYKLNSKSSSVKIKEIYYHEKDNIDKQIRFNGAVTLLKSGTPKIQPQREGAFYSYNSANASVYPQPFRDENGNYKFKPVKELLSERQKERGGGWSGGGGAGGRYHSSGGGSIFNLFEAIGYS